MLEYPDFTLFNVYFPNGKQNAQRLQYKMDFYDAILAHWESLRADGKKLVICGDVNTAHKAIDLARPKDNEKISGFLPMEREWIDKIVEPGIRRYIPAIRRRAGQLHLVAPHVRSEKAERGLAHRLLLRNRGSDAVSLKRVDHAGCHGFRPLPDWD